MSIPLKLRSGFSFDEAILMAKFSKRSYEIFQVGGGSVEDAEVQDIYNSLYKNEGWKLVHSLQNNENNIRGFIFKREGSNQLAVIFRGTIVTDRGQIELTDILTDLNWSLINYGSLPDTRVKVARGFFEGFEAVKDELAAFFQVLLGQINAQDFEIFQTLNPAKQIAIAHAIAAAGGIRFGLAFERRLKKLISEVFSYDAIGNLNRAWSFARDELLNFEDISREMSELSNSRRVGTSLSSRPKIPKNASRIEVFVGGHSLGGGLAQLGALFLKRRFSSLGESALRVKVYTFGSVKVGNHHFANYYNEQLGEGFSYRIENQLDLFTLVPFSLPFPLSMVAGNGLRLGELYLGNYEHVGEVHHVIGLGNHGVSLNFGGAAEFMGGIPFPHSFDTYIQLLQEDKKRWHQLWQPIRGILSIFLQEMLQEQEAEIVMTTEEQMRGVQEQTSEEIRSLKQSLDELKSEIQRSGLNLKNE
ncbi:MULTISPECIES: lipase family protein [unclassified Nostoc]|uniref:lipase family protein n=1 Tax=unclassified Nostoc TaxID=2593658 RepID=UPI0025AB507E|nr:MULTISPECIES: lipase family protein [unclassified Nostoc]MDM9582016.1 lipase family protein [Nostoc sp. GT001]MDZ7949453.1 lipase family protein [Nostoc sp. EfeVER01]MDZ7993757.1 lipase family protein [Nostoc sp. EspVER01]